MIKIRIDNTEYELNEENFDQYDAALRTAVQGSRYSGSTDLILKKFKEWAEAWEEQPSGYGVLDGYPALIEAAAYSLQLVADNVVPQVHEIFAQHILDLRRAWVNISHDPTEAGQFSNSLDTVTDALRQKLDELQQYSMLRQLQSILRNIFAISKRFLDGTYSCHHNAAREIKPEFEAIQFDSYLSSDNRSQIETYMAQEWDRLAFSTRV